MSHVIYKYEVELKVRAKETQQSTLVTCTEYAYSVTDALMQACLNHTATLEPDATAYEVTMHRVGPPQALIQVSASHAIQEVTTAMQLLAKLVKEPATVKGSGNG